ncbi:hypothetical protein ABW19_dt0203211 [Dactylella cylindrospora]|nr:hypothetical protein ABW19_dt0203211 [Dactylella cylindrospora]
MSISTALIPFPCISPTTAPQFFNINYAEDPSKNFCMAKDTTPKFGQAKPKATLNDELAMGYGSYDGGFGAGSEFVGVLRFGGGASQPHGSRKELEAMDATDRIIIVVGRTKLR